MGTGKKEAPFPVARPLDYTIDQSVLIRGDAVRLAGPLPAGDLEHHYLSETMKRFRPSCEQQGALQDLARQPDGLVFAASRQNRIIAYIAFHKPDYPWWSHRSMPCLLEMGALEVDSRLRNCGIASALLQEIFCRDNFSFFEHFIVIAVQTSCNWDLEGTGLQPWAYHRMMIHLLGKYGFRPRETDDPEISESIYNLLLVRFGSRIDSEASRTFDQLCISPDPCPG